MKMIRVNNSKPNSDAMLPLVYDTPTVWAVVEYEGSSVVTHKPSGNAIGPLMSSDGAVQACRLLAVEMPDHGHDVGFGGEPADLPGHIVDKLTEISVSDFIANQRQRLIAAPPAGAKRT